MPISINFKLSRILLFISIISLFSSIISAHKLAVYWGQDSAGSLKLKLEDKIWNFCQNYEYDIIPIAFLNVFFDTANKDDFPGINLANHCNKTFKGYPTLLNCANIGHQISQCQKSGKKILLSLGGAAGLYYFSSSSQAIKFAETIWELFLDGTSNIRPFHNAVLDGVDLDIEGGTTNYYADFVRSIRSLMASDNTKKYYISGAPQCPYPDVIMGPGNPKQVLQSVPQEFDYLYVQFYNNYCSLDQQKFFNNTIHSWFNFAEQTKASYGKGPLIFIGLPASPRVRGYQSVSVVKAAYNSVKNNANLGGIMLWDASFDENNIINGHHYSALIKAFMEKKVSTADNESRHFEIVVCFGTDGRRITISVWNILGVIGIVVVMTMMLLFVVNATKRRQQRHEKNVKTIQKDQKYSQFI